MSGTGRLRAGFVRLLRRVGKGLYAILPPSLCSRIACSRLGRALTNWAAPEGDHVYECDFGIRLKLSRDDALVFGAAQLGCMNPLETALVRAHLREGQVFVQVGGYKDGWLSLVASRMVGPTGKAICFEPVPEYCARLRENVALNGADNLIVEQLAAADREGETRFHPAGPRSSLVLSDPGAPGPIEVRTVSLDGYLRSRGISDVQFLTIDAEGAEPLILRGAAEILARSVPFLLMEVVDEFLVRAGFSPDEVIRSLAAMGYAPYAITRRGLKPYGESGRRSETLNVFFVKEKR